MKFHGRRNTSHDRFQQRHRQGLHVLAICWSMGGKSSQDCVSHCDRRRSAGVHSRSCALRLFLPRANWPAKLKPVCEFNCTAVTAIRLGAIPIQGLTDAMLKALEPYATIHADSDYLWPLKREAIIHGG